MVDHSVIDAVELLDPRPRQKRWASLSYCVLDAVWSIGALYYPVVVPLIYRVAAANSDSEPLVSSAEQLPVDPLPLPRLLERYVEASALQQITNRQRTSSRGGIPKTEAALRYARILVNHHVADLGQAEQVLLEETQLAQLDAALTAVPGDGAHGVRRGYLWMLCGNDDVIKPDRMVLRWLARHGEQVDANRAREVVSQVARQLTQRLGRPVTPWMVDHAIWEAERPRRVRRN